MTKKVLVSFYYDCGRMGFVDGLFVTDINSLEEVYGKEVYLGDVLGKHSEVYVDCYKECFKILSEDQEKIKWLVDTVMTGSNTLSGYNPIEYYKDQKQDEDESDD